jgi:hypothetical protein
MDSILPNIVNGFTGGAIAFVGVIISLNGLRDSTELQINANRAEDKEQLKNDKIETLYKLFNNLYNDISKMEIFVSSIKSGAIKATIENEIENYVDSIIMTFLDMELTISLYLKSLNYMKVEISKLYDSFQRTINTILLYFSIDPYGKVTNEANTEWLETLWKDRDAVAKKIMEDKKYLEENSSEISLSGSKSK